MTGCILFCHLLMKGLGGTCQCCVTVASEVVLPSCIAVCTCNTADISAPLISGLRAGTSLFPLRWVEEGRFPLFFAFVEFTLNSIELKKLQ